MVFLLNRRTRQEMARNISQLSDDQRSRLAKAMRDTLPLHVQDQVQAAGSDLEQRILTWSNNNPDYEKAYHEAGPRLQKKIDWVLAGLLSGSIPHCKHLTKDAGPRPVAIALWEDFLHCGCTMPKPLSKHEDSTCDLCGSYDADGVYPSAVVIGPLFIAYGQCASCREEERAK